MTTSPATQPGLGPKEARREEILGGVAAFMEEQSRATAFVAGQTPVPYSGTVAGGAEFRAMTASMLTGWFGAGRATDEFERAIAARFGRRKGLFVNSGSSANLVGTMAMTSRKVGGRLSRGDEVVTCVSGFPTTVNPLLQAGLKPVFVDTSIPTYNPTAEQLQIAVSSRTKAIIFAHTLGNPYDMKAVMDLVEDHDLWLLEDCCDALGSTYQGQPVGSFGDIVTCSFYPAHHITTGEGGMVCGDDAMLMRVAESIRDWGRDCWCPPGVDNTCGKRFNWQLGDLPEGYDHKYVYGEIGYNLKPLELQAAFGLEQMRRLDSFIEARRRNFRILTELLRPVRDCLVLPEATAGSDPSWFAFPLTVDGIDRRALVAGLEKRRIATRMLFGSNLLRQPAYAGLGLGDPNSFAMADRVMRDTFFVGTSPVVSEEMARYVATSIVELVGMLALR